MKIGFISTLFGPSWGGSEELWADTALLALREGHEVVFSTHGPVVPLPPKLKMLVEGGARHFYHRPRAEKLLRRGIAKLRKAAFGTQEYFPVDRRSPFRPFFAEKLSVICTSHGDAYASLIFPDMTEFLTRGSTPYIPICHGTINHIDLSDEGREVMQSYFRQAYRVAFVAQENVETTERQIAATIKNSLIVRNPVNLAGVEIVPWPRERTARFASVSRLDTVCKGQDVLLQALSADEWRARDWRLTVYGTGRHENYLRDLAAHYGIDDKVVFAGQVSDVRAIWAENHLLALPSRIEGTPLALIEAMICGRPSVITNIAGMPEWISEGETGFIAEAPLPDSFRAAMERAWRALPQWEAMGRNARRFAIDRYDADPARTLLDLLVKAAENK